MSLFSIKLAKKIRESSLRMVSAARASHIGSALSIADVLAVLYGDVMRYDPRNDQYEERSQHVGIQYFFDKICRMTSGKYLYSN